MSNFEKSDHLGKMVSRKEKSLPKAWRTLQLSAWQNVIRGKRAYAGGSSVR